MTTDRFAAARDIADTVLFEGYVLYPYRASAAKNRLRWQFGVLMPPTDAAAHAESDTARTEVLLDGAADADVTVQLRFLQLANRTIQRATDAGGFADTDRLATSTAEWAPWDEGVERRLDVVARLVDLLGAGQVREFTVPAGRDVEPIRDHGTEVGRAVRERCELRLRLRLSAAALPGPYRAHRLRVDVQNTGGNAGGPTGHPRGPGAASGREAATRRSLVATHTLVALSAGRFLSLVDPPEWAAPAAAACVNRHTWPVLVGTGADEVVLSSPIILDDHPEVAPESAGSLYDGTEIDEILTLRTMALTDAEKREARGTDARAAAVIDQVDALPPELLERLHGAIRSMRPADAAVMPADEPRRESALPPENDPPLQPWWDPGSDTSVHPDTDAVEVAGVPVARGSQVRLAPRLHGSDAQDLFLVGRTATVHAVLHDVDGGCHLAVTLDDDPGADLAVAQGRFRYFRPDELVPLAPGVPS